MNALYLAFKDDTHAEAGFPPRNEPQTLLDEPHAAAAALRSAHAVIHIGDRQYLVLHDTDVLLLLTDPRTTQGDASPSRD